MERLPHFVVGPSQIAAHKPDYKEISAPVVLGQLILGHPLHIKMSPLLPRRPASLQGRQPALAEGVALANHCRAAFVLFGP